ncbi:MAG: 3-deoxy-7-phosphoheptulonate synthase, partial [Deferribacterales bacterium]|nr:3-deoxy-7-phosphoheptulonate synthase [Deferribacterales bacterium]
MIIVIKPNTTKEQIEFITEKLTSYGYKLNVSTGVERTIIGAIGDENAVRDKPIKSFPGVEEVIPILKPYKLVSRDFKKDDTVV